ncbi:MAG: hypothetical protein QOG34_807 [Frankiaceae bacterium]|nr:hypothetical protein [Frankiaceae bacterium]
MKLAEALAQRAALMKRLEQLRARAQANARYQEGELPAEDAAELLTQADETLDELERLIRQINMTNARTDLAPDVSLTDALARRDVLRWRHSVYTGIADAASGNQHGSFVRQMRSELRILTAIPVVDLRRRADQLAKDYRELDVRIQQRNWEVDLIE